MASTTVDVSADTHLNNVGGTQDQIYGSDTVNTSGVTGGGGKGAGENEKRWVGLFDVSTLPAAVLADSSLITSAVLWFEVASGVGTPTNPDWYVKRCGRTEWIESEARWGAYGAKEEPDGYGTATGGDADELYDTAQSWTTAEWESYWISRTGGTGAGSGNARVIASNDATSLRVTVNWTAPDATSTYEIREMWTTGTGGGDPQEADKVSAGDIRTAQWYSPTITALVKDAIDSRSNLLSLLIFRDDADMGTEGYVNITSKEDGSGDYAYVIINYTVAAARRIFTTGY